MLFSLNILYLDLINFMISLCSFIPIWVFSILAWQLAVSDSIAARNNESDTAEFFWTVAPTSAVGALCYYNLNCISYDMLDVACKTVKVVGRQWYWTYEVEEDHEGEFDSVMSDFVIGVDKPLRLWFNEFYRFLVTSADVIHSFSIPEFNIKLDAIPGRLNYSMYCPNHYGIYIGYCTELCGAGHAYMPVIIEVVKAELPKGY
uniref:cytochrome-c oxidase n=1 Tax=Artyfechinostomum sufrartyfex TaxID=408854 RepID=A0A1P8P0K2_9TREM|nr:cytochrome c oxidase subunit II [Artyfechinostomum sufrartyfex]YP_010461012.1 cytochrome c oxidase subunit II [Artyfechinostomum malayanum]APX55334.1 cytochrome c oxidase subunit 2 [Artyfechinostomum sufrartyfex]ARH10834.1 cytochrome c oxidase subunit 2 [Artyfechinostomum sufrartyfex]UUF68165.1 cytochrome c oxidase subunit II [Artyfechinostomum malayanum]